MRTRVRILVIAFRRGVLFIQIFGGVFFFIPNFALGASSNPPGRLTKSNTQVNLHSISPGEPESKASRRASLTEGVKTSISRARKASSAAVAFVEEANKTPKVAKAKVAVKAIGFALGTASAVTTGNVFAAASLPPDLADLAHSGAQIIKKQSPKIAPEATALKGPQNTALNRRGVIVPGDDVDAMSLVAYRNHERTIKRQMTINGAQFLGNAIVTVGTAGKSAPLTGPSMVLAAKDIYDGKKELNRIGKIHPEPLSNLPNAPAQQGPQKRLVNNWVE